MKMFKKTVLAAALLAATGAANATIINNAGLGNELFLEVYDSAAGKTFNLDLKATLGNIQTNAGTALSAFAGGLNLGAANSIETAADAANWNSFIGGVANTKSLQYLVAVGSAPDSTIAVTGINAILPNADQTITLNPAGVKISSQAGYINAGMAAGANSSVIADTGLKLTGQLNNTGLPASSLWTGWSTHNPLQAYGSSVGFWLGGVHTGTVIDPLFGPTPTPMFSASDVTNLGTFTLGAQAGILTFTAPSQVPLPAAVWMFGAGLMGVLRLNRRKAA